MFSYKRSESNDLRFLSSRFVQRSMEGDDILRIHSTVHLNDVVDNYQMFRLIPACDSGCVEHVLRFLNMSKCRNIRHLVSLGIVEARCDGYDQLSAHQIGKYILKHETGVQLQYDNILLPSFDRGEKVDQFNPKIEKHISDLVHKAGNSSLPTSSRYVQNEKELPWNLDRIDQEKKEGLDSRLDLSCFPRLGKGVFIYVLDSGCLTTHEEFTGRIEGIAVGRYSTFEDAHGHGTHIAGTAAGSSLGVCKECSIICVKTLDENNKGSVMDVLNSIDWVIGHRSSMGDYPGVAVLSLGGKISTDLLDKGVTSLLENGVIPVVAAGNGYADACTWSPARSEKAITVAASTVDDFTRLSSNGGDCIDIAAPGEYIKSAAISGNTRTIHMSGTSMSAPLVAGAVGLILGENPFLDSREIIELLTRHSSPNVIFILVEITITKQRSTMQKQCKQPQCKQNLLLRWLWGRRPLLQVLPQRNLRRQPHPRHPPLQ
ncbi:Peptidase S8/S53 [Gracilaria domingensis]|nr:Peptidase S8/S53 [Gracilaria domingensis]